MTGNKLYTNHITDLRSKWNPVWMGDGDWAQYHWAIVGPEFRSSQYILWNRMPVVKFERRDWLWAAGFFFFSESRTKINTNCQPECVDEVMKNTMLTQEVQNHIRYKLGTPALRFTTANKTISKIANLEWIENEASLDCKIVSESPVPLIRWYL